MRGAAYDDQPVSFLNDEIALYSVSMLGAALGSSQPGGAEP